jgi:N-methylhydantoinase A
VRTFDARFYGQSWDTPLVEAPEGTIDATAIEVMVDRFRTAYEKVNGMGFGFIPVEAVAFRVQLVLPAAKVVYPELPSAPGPAEPSGVAVLEHLYERPTEAPEYRRDALGADAEVEGPAVIREPMSTTFVPSGRTAVVGAHGEITIT